jgi:hypothetical protein
MPSLRQLLYIWGSAELGSDTIPEMHAMVDRSPTGPMYPTENSSTHHIGKLDGCFCSLPHPTCGCERQHGMYSETVNEYHEPRTILLRVYCTTCDEFNSDFSTLITVGGCPFIPAWRQVREHHVAHLQLHHNMSTCSW